MDEKTINKQLEVEKSDPKNIVIEIHGGCFTAIHNIPEGYTYKVIDWDSFEVGE